MGIPHLMTVPSQEITAQVEEVSASAQELVNLATQLQAVVDLFKLY